MNDRPDPRSRLLAEAFSDDWNGGDARVFALRAAAHVRRRRRTRRTLLSAAAVVVVIGALSFSTRNTHPASPATKTNAAESSRPESTAPLSKVSPAFEIISDEELFANLQAHPLLILPDQPAERRYVVLGR